MTREDYNFKPEYTRRDTSGLPNEQMAQAISSMITQMDLHDFLRDPSVLKITANYKRSKGPKVVLEREEDGRHMITINNSQTRKDLKLLRDPRSTEIEIIEHDYDPGHTDSVIPDQIRNVTSSLRYFAENDLLTWGVTREQQ